MGVTIRLVNDQDLPAINAIEQACYPDPWSEGIMRDCLQMDYPFLIIEMDSNILGYIIFAIAADECHILNLAIMPEYQGQGLASQLLMAVINFARENDLTTLFLEVRLSNHPARGLYEKLGFQQVGKRKAYYPADNGREDAIILRLDL